jgi:cell division protein FtsB
VAEELPMTFLIRILFCIFVAGFFIYMHIDHQNRLTQQRMQIPLLKRELQRIEEDNTALRYQIEVFERPQNLLKLAKQPEYKHLHYPYVKDVIVLSGQRRQ